MNNEIRWKQRFQNFEKAINRFQVQLDICKEEADSPYFESFQMALVQSFEILIELSWKVLKDYLENEGYNDVKNGKKAIRQAFQDEIIREAEIWMSALEKRNLTSHTYDDEILEELTDFARDSFVSVAWDLYYQLKKDL